MKLPKTDILVGGMLDLGHFDLMLNKQFLFDKILLLIFINPKIGFWCWQVKHCSKICSQYIYNWK